MTPGEMADRLDMQWFPDAVSAAAMLREAERLLTWHREGDGNSEPEYVAWCLHRDAWLEGGTAQEIKKPFVDPRLMGTLP